MTGDHIDMESTIINNDLSSIMWQDVDPLSTLKDFAMAIAPSISVDVDIDLINGGDASAMGNS